MIVEHLETECDFVYKVKGQIHSGNADKFCKLFILGEGVKLAQLVKATVGQTDLQRFEPHLGYNWLSCGVFLVQFRHFGLPLAQTIRPNWQSLLAGGSVAIQTWSI